MMIDKYLKFSLVLLSLYAPHVLAKKIIVKVPNLENLNYNDTYHISLLKLALSKSGVEYEIQRDAQGASHERLARELEKGSDINLFWLGSSASNAKRFIEVPIPLFRGLLGHRIFLVHKKDIDKFKDVRTLKDLQKFRGVVGTGWPDQDIMEKSGLALLTSSYKNAFKLIDLGNRVDYFPRAAFEVATELEDRKDELKNLVMEKKLSLVYKFAVLFYASPKSPEVAEAVHRGLKKAYEDGSFMKHFRESPIIKRVKEVVRPRERHQIIIPNPFLSLQTKKIPDHYWELPISEKEVNSKRASLLNLILAMNK